MYVYTEEMKELYMKKKNGTATPDELIRLDILIKTSCVDENFLLFMLENSNSEE